MIPVPAVVVRNIRNAVARNKSYGTEFFREKKFCFFCFSHCMVSYL